MLLSKHRFLILLFLVVILTNCKKKLKSDSHDEINFSFHERNFGASADELLRDDKFTSLKVEVQYMDGFKPDKQALLNLRKFLVEHLHKPGGIYFIQRRIKPVKDTILSRKQVDAIRRANRREYTQNNQLAVYILYTNGEFENPDILGQAFRNTSIVIYGKSVRENTNTFSNPTPTLLESTLLLHEMGHLLGLVNKGSALTINHADSANEAHCKNRNCVMYWGISIRNRYGPLVNKPIPQFDTACLQDLKNNGGR